MTIDNKTLLQLIWLRGFAIFLQLVVLATAKSFLNISLPNKQILTIILLYILFNTYIYWQYKNAIPIKEKKLFIQFIVDVIILCSILYYAGGATNPFISLLLFPLTISATLFTAGYTWIMSAVVISAYSILMINHIPLPHNHAGVNEFSLHIWGMWFGFLLSVGLVSFFILSIKKSLYQKETQLNIIREQALKDKQLISLATLSASTAHELGTPLATISLLCDEVSDELSSDIGCSVYDNHEKAINVKNELILPMKQEVRRCKDILSTLASTSGGIHLKGGHRLNFKKFIERLIDEWQNSHRNIIINVTCNGQQQAPDIVAEKILEQAILNLLNNAYAVSKNDIVCILDWDKKFCYIDILDSGPGLDNEQLQLFGQRPIVSQQQSKELESLNGMGLGSFLSYSIIEKLGGEIKLSNRKEGGLTVRIILPNYFIDSK